METPSKFINFLLKHKGLLIFSFFALIMVFVLSNYGFITIDAQSTSSGEFTYKLTDQNAVKTQEIKTASSKITKLVRKAPYEVVVTQGEKSAFAITKTAGFLTKKTIRVSPTPEKAREFVGNNPEPCMYYLAGVLHSYACSAAISSTTHVPATATQATYIVKNSNNIFKFGEIEGIINTKSGTTALIHITEADEGANHIAFVLRDGVKLSEGVTLTDLSADKSYKTKPYKDGFLVFDQALSEVFYYASISAKPERITIEKPKDASLKPLSLSVHGASLLVVYSSSGEEDVTDAPGAHSEETKAELLLNKDGKITRSTIKDTFSEVVLCGVAKACLLSEKLKVYDIGGANPSLSFTILGVEKIENSASGLLAFRGGDILSLDVDKQTGSVDYTLGDHRYCGAQLDTDGYLLCLINTKNKKIALRINQLADNVGSIDKKVAELQNLPEVTDVSAYGKYIFISPNLGQLVYSPAIGGFDYDPETKKAVNNKMNQELVRLGIDTNVYTVINTKK